MSAWAFGGAKVGETSELFDDDNGYYLARLDIASARRRAEVRECEGHVRDTLSRRARGRQRDAAGAEAVRRRRRAARSRLRPRRRERRSSRARSSRARRMVPGLGQFNEAIGAAFALPTGAVSQPVRTETASTSSASTSRIVADSAAWAAQQQVQRADAPQAAARAAHPDVPAGSAEVGQGRRPAEADQRVAAPDAKP